MEKSNKISLIFLPIVWLAVMVLYMIIGGAVFHATESVQYIDRGGVIPAVNFTSMKLSLAEKYNLSMDAIEQIHAEVRRAEENHQEHLTQKMSIVPWKTWSFLNSCLYAMTVFTTTGYGAWCPETILGKVLTCFYAAAGIPLFIKFVCVFGGVLNQLNFTIVKKLIPVNKPCVINSCKITLASFVMAIFLCLSAGYHTLGSSWDFRTALYFSFITFSTVGFGDFTYTADNVQRFSEYPKTLLVGHAVMVFIGFALLGGVIRALWDAIQEHPRKRPPQENKREAGRNKKIPDQAMKMTAVA